MERTENILPLELAGRAILAVVAIVSRIVCWWCPLVAVPVFCIVWNTVFLRQQRSYVLSIKTSISEVLVQRRIANLVSWVVEIAYLAYATVSVGLHVKHWYGWTAGAAIGLAVAQVGGLLRPYRLRYEQHNLAVRQEARGLD